MKPTLALLLALATAAPALGRDAVRAPHGAVASATSIASQVGVDVMRRGGNAVDAAVAVAFALAVTWPPAGNLGGGGFMLIRKADGTSEAIDYRERAPLAATRTMYLDASGNVVPGLSSQGYKAVAVPGTVAGMALAHRRHGKLKWAELVEPARKLAADGFPVSYQLARYLRFDTTAEKFAPFAESRRIFLRDGRIPAEGERFVQPELAATLARIRDEGADGFYRGDVARRIAAEMREHGGLITERDLQSYEPTVRKPLRGTYRGYEILTMPPPSSGGIALLEMLNMLEAWDVGSLGWHSARHMHLVVEVMRRAFADRAEFLGDTDFAAGVPVAGLLSKEYAARRREGIDFTRATASREVRPGRPAAEPTETTHFSIVDKAGNVVSNTYTLNDSFGAGVTVRGTGVLLNNEMDDFTSKPGVPNDYNLIQGEANAIEPRKRPLSSMTPTIVLRDGQFRFAVGGRGGPTIITAVFHVVSNVIDFGMSLQDAVDAKRFHHQWLPDHIAWEEFGRNADTQAVLEKMGHRFRDIAGIYRNPSPIADVHAVGIDPENGMRLGASDHRTSEPAAGW